MRLAQEFAGEGQRRRRGGGRMKDPFLSALLNRPGQSMAGQIYVREAGYMNGRRLVMVCGVFASNDLEGECQYQVAGSPNRLVVSENSKQYHGERFEGHTLGSGAEVKSPRDTRRSQFEPGGISDLKK